ncbi:ABC transporter permease [Miniphocaeibacter halophilus]|uniref:ABC transporter permease n=1 Tax=Miniphocaeibacter halophilus TaxID=2931922 RepID=A0AC61N3E1_9FIRM|nr:ABC transporter permease [Miniphocaeibacter halophilus]QQK07853.1 ABC transporter permease [Miniphocaeibacter halophilus]
MVINNYKLKLKELFQNKSTLFFSLTLPIIFLTLFNLTIANIDNEGLFETIPIAVENTAVAKTLGDIKISDKEKAFKIIESSDYEKDLKEEEITAYIKGSENLEVVVKDYNLSSSLVYETVNMYKHIHKMYGKVLAKDININPEEIMDTYNKDNNIKNKFDSSSKNESLIYFFTILAMACLSASNQGIDIGEILNPKSEMRYVKRILVSPTNKFKLIFSQFLGALTFSLFVTYVAIGYLLILKASLAEYLPKIIITSTLGTILGLLFGVLISLLLKTKLATKYNISAIIYVFSCFLAGMMVNTTPYIIEEKLPIIKYINPATVITKAYKNIYYFENNSSYLLNLFNILALIIIFVILILFTTRRRKNENI